MYHLWRFFPVFHSDICPSRPVVIIVCRLYNWSTSRRRWCRKTHHHSFNDVSFVFNSFLDPECASFYLASPFLISSITEAPAVWGILLAMWKVAQSLYESNQVDLVTMRTLFIEILSLWHDVFFWLDYQWFSLGCGDAHAIRHQHVRFQLSQWLILRFVPGIRSESDTSHAHMGTDTFSQYHPSETLITSWRTLEEMIILILCALVKMAWWFVRQAVKTYFTDRHWSKFIAGLSSRSWAKKLLQHDRISFYPVVSR